MTGTISGKSGLLLSDLLQMLCQNQKAGCLKLYDKATEETGFINLQQGSVLNASFGGEKDLDAMVKLFQHPQLEFELLPNLRDEEDRIRMELTDLLLQCTVALDTSEEDQEALQQLHTYYVLKNGASIAEGGNTEEENLNFKHDVDFIHYQSKKIGDTLSMNVLTAAALCGPDDQIAFKFIGNEAQGVRSKKSVNSAKLLELV